jgi:hypothetical protein
MARCGSNDDISKSRRRAETSCTIRRRAGDPRRWHVERQDAIAIKVQNRFEPCGVPSALSRGPFSAQLGNPSSIPQLSRKTGRATPNAHPSMRPAQVARDVAETTWVSTKYKA